MNQIELFIENQNQIIDNLETLISLSDNLLKSISFNFI